MTMYFDRQQAGERLLERLRGCGDLLSASHRPLVLAIPRGGVEVGAVIARGLGADLDVVLVGKLRARGQPELALGAVSEAGETFLNDVAVVGDPWIESERQRQLAVLARRLTLYRGVREQVPWAGHVIIVTDDGLATGATMIAALRAVRASAPERVIVALPVASASSIPAIESLCDRLECLQSPSDFMAVGQYYRSFEPVSDERVVELLRQFGSAACRVVSPSPRAVG
jgi:putative phosphoribosyl transferase